MSKYITDCHINLYADDTALYIESPSYIELILSLRLELATLSQWMLANKLTLNVRKMKFMIFGTKPKLCKLPTVPLQLSINNQAVEQVTNFKYLGIILDDSLNFMEHVDYIYKKSCCKLGAIKKCRKYLNKNLTLILYKSLVAPHIDYCDIVYMQDNQGTLQKLQIVQNMACRVILEAGPRDHIDNMHRELKLDLLKNRRSKHLFAECHKNIHTDKVLPLKRFFVFNRNCANRRTRRVCKYDVLVPRLQTSSGQRAFSFVGPSTWNRLSADLKEIVKHKSFKNKLKKIDNIWDNHPT